MPDYDPPFPMTWAIGDPVFARYLDPNTGSYVIRQEGMVVRIEGNQLVLATERGEKLRNASDWPTWKTREAAEASIAKDPRPVQTAGPMAHYTPPVPEQWECLRCLQIVEGMVTVPDHHRCCPYRDTGRDPDPRG